jgi:hypothetical protein
LVDRPYRIKARVYVDDTRSSLKAGFEWLSAAEQCGIGCMSTRAMDGATLCTDQRVDEPSRAQTRARAQQEAAVGFDNA